MTLDDSFAIAGKHFEPAISEGWCELFVECFADPEPFVDVASRFAARHGGRLQRLKKETWHVPLLRVALPLPQRSRPMVAFTRLAEQLFQALLRKVG